MKGFMHWIPIETQDGTFQAGFSSNGLKELHFPAKRAGRGEEQPVAVHPQMKAWLKMLQGALTRALSGKPAGVLPPLDLDGTGFQQSVWRVLTGIPAGQTLTYNQVAEAVDRPRAARAVGQACGANPIPVLIPCHRVLASGGTLGGFSGGLDWKIELLKREGVVFARQITPKASKQLRRAHPSAENHGPENDRSSGCDQSRANAEWSHADRARELCLRRR